MELYRHTQPGYVVRISMLIGLAVSVGVFANMRGMPGNGALIAGVTSLALFISLLLFHSLTVVVTEHELRLSFGPGLIRRSWPLENVASWKAVRNPWYYGFGIHLTRYGWLYNVSGLSAVELTLRDGTRCRIGTDAPDELNQVLARSKRAVA